MSTILPGATLGILGGGQLGRMIALAARRMGYRTHVLADAADSPAGQAADAEFVGDARDVELVRRFAAGVAVVTYEFENMPVEAVTAAAELCPVRPGARPLSVSQHRIMEKQFLQNSGVAVAPFAPITQEADLAIAAEQVGFDSIIKTARGGYDGKGQRTVRNRAELDEAWRSFRQVACVLERRADIAAECSVIVARGVTGDIAVYAPILNHHHRHILDLSIAPAGLSSRIEDQAVEMARVIAQRLELVGLICVEYFVTADGQLLVNELAPRPHNSGHLTIEAHATSQFEQAVRAMCGLPLGSTRLVAPAAMTNLLGDLWAGGEPDWARALTVPEVRLHLYGKSSPAPGRKMGHLTATAPTAEEAAARARQARTLLTSPHDGMRDPGSRHLQESSWTSA